MGILYAAVMAVLLVNGAASGPHPVAERLDGSTEPSGGFVTKEWAWMAGATPHTLTAYGPTEQVNRLDPLDRTPRCPECQLASSMRLVPEQGTGVTEVAH